MQLTLLTDLSLRVLLYLGTFPENVAPAGAIAKAYGVSAHHVAKVAKLLTRDGYLHATRGNQGGLRLARPPEQIRLSEVIERYEPHMNLVECFDPSNNNCRISPICRLKRTLFRARKAFIDALAEVTLADLVLNRESASRLLEVPLGTSGAGPRRPR